MKSVESYAPSDRADCPRCGITRKVNVTRKPGLCRDCPDCLTKPERLVWAA